MTSHERGSDSSSVLIVDDDPNFRALLKVLLETTGCQVLEARSGKDADLILSERRPALLIVDYRLPGLDGVQWITKFREEGYKTPIIFLSGTWCDLPSFTKLRSLLKVSLILQKPIVPELFLDQTENLLPSRRGESAEEAYDPQAWSPSDTSSFRAFRAWMQH
jgi:DNA-binding response OmpR family regulator